MSSSLHAVTPTLALLYITDHYAQDAQDILDHLSAELPSVTDWSGTVGIGIAANNVEYFDEPAMAVMLLDLPSDQYRVFSGVSPLSLGFEAHTALVHADGATADLPELLAEMSGRTETGYLFGGLSSSRGKSVQFALAAPTATVAPAAAVPPLADQAPVAALRPSRPSPRSSTQEPRRAVTPPGTRLPSAPWRSMTRSRSQKRVTLRGATSRPRLLAASA
jgi:hypothetical protein